VASWQAQKVDTLIVTSSEQLEYLNRMMHSQAQQWLHQQHLLVPSERIAAIAHSLGFARVTNVGSAANMELLAALQPK
jgi:uroporphyrinogen-III synthase